MYSIALNLHDHNTYDGVYHNQLERHSRHKRNLYPRCHKDFYEQHARPAFDNDDLYVFSYTHGSLHSEYSLMHPLKNELKPYAKDIESFVIKSLWDYYHKDNVYYINHHQSHAAYAFLSSKYQEADILAIDGGGINYSTVFFDKTGKAINLSEEFPLGWLWNVSCNIAGLKNQEAGKLMGLAAYGKFSQRYYDILELLIEERKVRKFWHIDGIEKSLDPKDVAFTIQQFTLDKIAEIIIPYKTSNNICIAGGCAYNGYMNEKFTEYYDNVFVPPAPGDEGQALGNYMHASFMLDRTIHIPELYAGKDYNLEDENIDYYRIAQMIADGKIIGWFQGKSESGHRALGNRSILADPRNPNIKDIINHRIKKREDWRPFAPSVLEESYLKYFDTRLPSPYMSRIATVKSEEIPGVTHIDNTSRIQTVTQQQNEKYYKLISAFYDITGIPMVLNTSFNCQEPIVETPEDAMKTFNKTELDAVIIGNKVTCK